MKVYPVVHINDSNTAQKQGELSLELGADGIYLIDHNGEVDTIFETLRKIRFTYPDSFIGINLLGHLTDKVYERIDRMFKEESEAILPNAVWVDNV